MEGTLESKEGQVIVAGTFKGNLYYNSLRAQPGAKLDVQLIKGLDKKEKTSQKNNSSKKAKKV